MTVYTVTNRKAASAVSLSCYKIDDKVAGWTTPGRYYRKDYKRAVRHTRRLAKMALARTDDVCTA